MVAAHTDATAHAHERLLRQLHQAVLTHTLLHEAAQRLSTLKLLTALVIVLFTVEDDAPGRRNSDRKTNDQKYSDDI